MIGPDPNTVYPMKGFPRVCFIKNTVRNPNIIIGDYTYYDDPLDSEELDGPSTYPFSIFGNG